MSIGTPINRVGDRGFRVTGRSRTGGNFAPDKGGSWVEAVLSSIEGAEHETDWKASLARHACVRGPLIHDFRVPPIASQHNFIVQPLVTKEWNARAF